VTLTRTYDGLQSLASSCSAFFCVVSATILRIPTRKARRDDTQKPPQGGFDKGDTLYFFGICFCFLANPRNIQKMISACLSNVVLLGKLAPLITRIECIPLNVNTSRLRLVSFVCDSFCCLRASQRTSKNPKEQNELQRTLKDISVSIILYKGHCQGHLLCITCPIEFYRTF
jgi:hypothetical protein